MLRVVSLCFLALSQIGFARRRSASERDTSHHSAIRAPLRRARGPSGRRGALDIRKEEDSEGIFSLGSLDGFIAVKEEFDVELWLPFEPLAGMGPGRKRCWPPGPPAPETSLSPVSIEDSDSIRCLIESNAAIIKSVSTVPATAGISSFDLFAGQYPLELGFFVDVELGTPSKTFRMQIDTSSADFCVGGEHCTSCAPTHGKLGAASSSSFQLAAQNEWTTPESYSSNFLFSGTSDFTNVTGVSCNDTVSIAGLELPTMAFGVAREVQNEYTADWLPFDGVFGLANVNRFPPVSLQHIASPIQQLADAGLIPRAQVGIYVGRATRAGQLALGGVDATIFDGNLTTVESISRLGYWEAPVQFEFGGRATASFANRSAIFDTRSATILAPAADIAALQLTADAHGHILLPCNGGALLMTLNLGGQSFPIPATDLILLPLTEQSCDSPPCCLSALQVAPASLGLKPAQWIVGTAALKSIYLSLDYETAAMGFATVP